MEIDLPLLVQNQGDGVATASVSSRLGKVFDLGLQEHTDAVVVLRKHCLGQPSPPTCVLISSDVGMDD